MLKRHRRHNARQRQPVDVGEKANDPNIYMGIFATVFDVKKK